MSIVAMSVRVRRGRSGRVAQRARVRARQHLVSGPRAIGRRAVGGARDKLRARK